jgi:hypothetical protein
MLGKIIVLGLIALGTYVWNSGGNSSGSSYNTAEGDSAQRRKSTIPSSSKYASKR